MRACLRFIGHQQYLRFDLRDRIIRRIDGPDQPREERFTVNFFGMRYPGSFGSFLDWSVYYFGAYARKELVLFRDIVGDLEGEAVAADIGANVGHHSLFLAKYCRRVLSFEPYPPLYEKILEKAKLNGLEGLKAFNCGLGEKAEVLQYYPPNTTNMGTGSFCGSFDCNTSEAVELEVRRGDEVLGEEGLARLDLVKIDVESFEVPVLRGIRETLERYRPAVFLEFSPNTPKGLAEGERLEDLFPEDYEVFHFQPEGRFLRFFEKTGYTLVPVRGEDAPFGNLFVVPREKRGAAIAGRVRRGS